MADGRLFVITGCASGIGRHLARAIAGGGDRVIATDVDDAALERAAEADGWDRARVTPARLDVRRPEDWEAALDLADRGGGADVLLGVAGVLKPGYVVDATPRDIDFHIDVNVKGVMLGTTAAARRMVDRGRGHIINFGSLASLTPVAGLGLYSASKFAVRGFSLAAAQELAPRGVAVTVVMPDAVQTPMLDLQVGYDEAALTFSGSRALTVEEIEAVVLGRVLRERPVEVTIPFSRGVLARLSTALPGAVMKLAPWFAERGRRRQAEVRARRQ